MARSGFLVPRWQLGRGGVGDRRVLEDDSLLLAAEDVAVGIDEPLAVREEVRGVVVVEGVSRDGLVTLDREDVADPDAEAEDRERDQAVGEAVPVYFSISSWYSSSTLTAQMS
jgi:hypothetical protein